jgi:hypothetical protein
MWRARYIRCCVPQRSPNSSQLLSSQRSLSVEIEQLEAEAWIKYDEIALQIGMTVKQKVTLSLDKELIEFLDLQANNRSEYLNELLVQHRSQVLANQIKAALQEDLNDPDYLSDIQDWDAVVGDGLDAQR